MVITPAPTASRTLRLNVVDALRAWYPCARPPASRSTAISGRRLLVVHLEPLLDRLEVVVAPALLWPRVPAGAHQFGSVPPRAARTVHPGPARARIRSTAVACGTVRGNPSISTPRTASLRVQDLADQGSTTSSGTRQPLVHVALGLRPSVVPCLTAARSSSPVETWGCPGGRRAACPASLCRSRADPSGTSDLRTTSRPIAAPRGQGTGRRRCERERSSTRLPLTLNLITRHLITTPVT